MKSTCAPSDRAGHEGDFPGACGGLGGPLRLAGVLGLALAIRFLNFPGVFHGGEIYLFGTDSYAHIRRIWLGVLHYPFVPYGDPYVNFPDRAISQWPPGFDLILASLVRLVSPLAPKLQTAETVSALAIPFLGLLSIYFTGRIARAVGGGIAGIFGMLVLALLPAHVLPTRLANVDHHVIELAALAWLSALWAEAVRRPEISRRVALPSGLLLALCFGLWSSPQLLVLLLCIGFVAGAILDAWRGRYDLKLASAQRRFLAIALMASLPVVLISPYARAWRVTDAGISWLHPLFLLLCLGGLAAVQHILARVAALPEARRFRALAFAFLVGSVLMTVIFLAPRFVPLLGQTVAYVQGADPQARFAAEARPVTDFPVSFTLHFFGVSLVLAIPAFFFLLRRLDRPRAMLTAWLLATATLAALQMVRLGPYLAIFLVVLIGCAAAGLWQKGGWRRVAAMALMVIAVLPGVLELRVSRRIETLDGNPWFLAVDEALEWIRLNTPPTSGWENTRVKPEYSVLAQWSYGNWINHIARRRSVANPFSRTPAHLHGFADSIRFMLADREDAADRIARARVARYVIATPILYTYPMLAEAVGAPVAPYAARGTDGLRYKPAFFRIVANRLTLLDGSEEPSAPGGGIPALAHYRLVFEGDAQTSGDYAPEGERVSTPEHFSYAKVFERVEGARLAGRVLPLDRLEARVEVVTNQRRHFTWRTSVRAGANGTFELTVPYATEEPRGGR